MGFFNPSFHLVSNKPFLKGRSTDVPQLGSGSILLWKRYSCSLAFPPGTEILPTREPHLPSDDSQTAYGSQKNVSALNLLTWLHQDNQDPEISSCSYNGKVGERREIENSASVCETPRLPPTTSLPAMTQTDHCFITVITSPKVLNTLQVLSIHSTQSNSTHLRYWEDNSHTFKSF